MQYHYFKAAVSLRSSTKRFTVTLFFLCLLLTGTAGAQTVIFSEDFESAGSSSLLPHAGWSEYETSAGNSRWAVGAGSCVITGSNSLFVVRNVIGNSCDYAPASASNKIAYKSFSTTNYNNLTLSFKWVCNGEKIGSTFNDYGKVCLSLDGVTWTNLPANYQGETTAQNVVDLALPAAAFNQPVVYLGFRWINDGTTKHIPGFVVDDIVVKGSLMSSSATPALTSLSAASGCAGAPLTITGTDLGSATGVTIGGTAATITANTATSITVTVGSGTTGDVVVTTAGGVSNGLPFVVKPTPVLTVTPSADSICNGTATSFALSSSVTGATYTFTASPLSGATVTGYAGCLTGCPSTIAQTLSVPGTVPGSIRYTATAIADGCSSAPLDIDATVFPNPPATVTPASTTICSGATINLALSTGMSSTVFTWAAPAMTGGTTIGATAGTGDTITQTLINPSSIPDTLTYTIIPSNPGGCTTGPLTATVIVNPGAAITAQPVGNTQCGGSHTFSVSTVNASGFQWYGPSGIIPGATDSTYTIAAATAAQTGDYYVLVMGPPGCAPLVSALATLNVSDPISISVQPANKKACEGTPFTLSVTGTGAVSYQWYKNGNPITGATGASYTVASPVASDAGSYYVKLIAGAPCASVNSSTVTVTVSIVGTWFGYTNNWNHADNWCGGIPTATTDVVLPATGSVAFDAHIKDATQGTARNVTLQNSSLTVDNGGTLQLFGNLSFTPAGSFTSDGGTLRLSGTTDQYLQPGFTASTMMVEGGGNKHLGNDSKITNLLVLGDGKVMLDGHTLRLGPGANIYGVSASSYVVTNGTGGGLQQVVGTPEYIFPVGVSSFNPLYISNKGAKDSFLVKVREEVLEDGGTGAPVNPAHSAVILRTWDVTESVPGGTNATITLQWNLGEHNSPAFTYEHTYIAQYKDGMWVNTCCASAFDAGVAAGDNPYTRTQPGITQMGHFTVASDGGSDPLTIGSAQGAQFDVQVFPNPVRNVLTVVISGAHAQSRVSLLDMTGRELGAHFASTGRVTFDMQGLAQGVYFVKYMDGQQTRTIKVSKH